MTTGKNPHLIGSNLFAFRRSRRRSLEVHARRQDGELLREIAQDLGLSPARVRDLEAKGARIIARDYAHVGEACELFIAVLKRGGIPQAITVLNRVGEAEDRRLEAAKGRPDPQYFCYACYPWPHRGPRCSHYRGGKPTLEATRFRME